MDQLRSFADERLVAGCIYCGSFTVTRDHVPPRILLDEPYPENLPVVPACVRCNQSFSLDEEYLACLLDSVIAGSAETARRDKVRRTLAARPAIANRLTIARSVAIDGAISFDVEQERIRNMVLKLATGHAAYELPFSQNTNALRAKIGNLYFTIRCYASIESRSMRVKRKL